MTSISLFEDVEVGSEIVFDEGEDVEEEDGVSSNFRFLVFSIFEVLCTQQRQLWTTQQPLSTCHFLPTAEMIGISVFLTILVSYCAAESSESASTVSDVVVLTESNFEQETQASTGATTGDWLVEFYAPWYDLTFILR